MKVLLIGASGFLGRTVSYKLKQSGAEVLGTYHSNPKDDFVRLDIMDVKSLIALYREFRPDAVVWTLMNLELEEEIAEAVMPVFCETIGMTRFVFLSTSVAYEKNMSEDVVPMLRSGDMYHHQYFNGKIKSERIIQTTGNYCIVRPGSIYGVNPYGETDIRSRSLKEHVDSGTAYARAGNIQFSIVEVNELADAVVELIDHPYVGIINVSEEQPVSHYEFNKALCKKYGWDDSCVIRNEAEENIYYLDNQLRKRILKTEITSIHK